MVSTAKAQLAAAATAHDKADKEAALAASAAKDKAAADTAQMLKDLANLDATHRGQREAIAAAAAAAATVATATTADGTLPPFAATAPVQPDTAQALAPPIAVITPASPQTQCSSPTFRNRFNEAMGCMTFNMGQQTVVRRRRKSLAAVGPRVAEGEAANLPANHQTQANA